MRCCPGVMRVFVLLQHLPFALATIPLLFTFRRKRQPPIPAKGPLGSIRRLKAASLLGAASSHLLCRVYRNTMTALYRLVLPNIRKASGYRGCDALLGECLPTFRRPRCLRSLVSIIFVQQNPSDCRQYVLWKRR